MHVSNDQGALAGGPFADIVRLQAEFQTRMAEETLRYLRSVQATLEPAVPTTVVQASSDAELEVAGAPGEHVEVEVEVENVQEAHVSASPALTPLVGSDGTAWFPLTEAVPPLALVPPGETATLRVGVRLPDELPAGEYRGALLLLGFRHGGLPLVVRVEERAERDTSPDAEKKAAGAAQKAAPAARKRSTTAKAPAAAKREAAAKKATRKTTGPALPEAR